ncbi:SRPBCC family protein [Luteimonas viscosa]|uniref:SRPBCC family protein n=1 Tax=Luteimonas viscosa TaxID=1132694 RepID=UPI0016541091|nr:SRPBCC family protein [Luteimonas viscosa]
MDHSLVASKCIAIDSPRETVWRVLTQPEYVRQYLFGAELVTDWTVGNAVIFRGEYQGQPWQDHGVVLEVERPARLRYSYYGGACGLDDRPEHYATVTYALEETPHGTALTVRQQGYRDEASRSRSEGSWEGILAQVRALSEAG